MIKRMIIMLAGVGLLFGLVFGFQAFKAKMIEKAMAALRSPAQTVSTATAATQDWQSQLEAVGSLRAVKGADLSLEVSGIVDAISFESGDDVQAGTVLVRLRSSDDLAKLQSLQASAELALINYNRDVKQLAVKAVAQATVDTDEANLKSFRAQVAEQQAVLDKKTLKAPFAGHLGVRQADLGQYLTAGTMVVTLQALDPIYVDFYLPQQSLDRVSVGQPVAARIDTYPNQTFTGAISAVNPKVDQNTRNVQIRATMNNPDHKLLPGMYATVDIAVGAPQKYVTLPQTAITFSSYGDTVYVVDKQGDGAGGGQPQLVARQTFVTTGPTRGDQIAILKGINAGDTIVTAGQVKLRNGSPVVINNTVQPSDNPNPKPAQDETP
jgi:membrane fusion protein, multidrug efflux system